MTPQDTSGHPVLTHALYDHGNFYVLACATFRNQSPPGRNFCCKRQYLLFIISDDERLTVAPARLIL
jgi:hypothetical protein